MTKRQRKMTAAERRVIGSVMEDAKKAVAAAEKQIRDNMRKRVRSGHCYGAIIQAAARAEYAAAALLRCELVLAGGMEWVQHD